MSGPAQIPPGPGDPLRDARQRQGVELRRGSGFTELASHAWLFRRLDREALDGFNLTCSQRLDRTAVAQACAWIGEERHERKIIAVRTALQKCDRLTQTFDGAST